MAKLDIASSKSDSLQEDNEDMRTTYIIMISFTNTMHDTQTHTNVLFVGLNCQT